MTDETPLNSPQSQHLTGAPPTLDGRRDYQLDVRNDEDVLIARYFLYDSPIQLVEEGADTAILTGINSEPHFILKRLILDFPVTEEIEDYVEGMEEAA